eukprot:CAMPEP_0172785508 /NCGR_PEP_ID=MMETSP1074-20121228/205479_1 /TAXON_ID=2916 /ORGANISM="Ceratium fusus, Strain PA161109" /LENGTH=398 /DNA_ID=CAMNT_0013622517 /DNA_START=605 /DNA_END=1801 /DNA_ORIENTATION=-
MWDWLPNPSWITDSLEAVAEHHGMHKAAHRLGTSLLLFRSSVVARGGAARNNVSGDNDGKVASKPIAVVNSTIDVASLAATGEKGAAVAKQKLSWKAWFYLTFSFTFVLKCLCMFSNMMGQVSPIPQVAKFRMRGSTGEADAAPFISMLYGSLQWSFYGCFAFTVTGKSGFLVLVYSNVFGCLLGSYYVYGFLVNCKSERSLHRLSIYYRLVSVFVLMQIIAIMELETRRALFFVGLASSICGMMGACSLLTTLPQVIETQCSASINMPLLVTGLISGSLWLICGIVLHDIWILGPNIVGLLLQSFAVAAVLYFPRHANTKATMQGAQDLLPRFHGQPSMQKKAYLSDEESAFVPGPVVVGKTPQIGTGCKEYGTLEQHQQVRHHKLQQQSCGETGGT